MYLRCPKCQERFVTETGGPLCPKCTEFDTGIEIKCARCRDRFEAETEDYNQLCPVCKEFDKLAKSKEVPGKQGILVFSLPDSQNEFEVAVKAMDFALAWNDLRDKVRNELKYTTPSPAYQEALELTQKLMQEIAIDRELPEIL